MPAGTNPRASIVLDSSGNIYIVGYSHATWGSPVRAYTGNYDAFVAKFSPNGTLLWNTFLGGTLMDLGFAIGLDGSGNIYVSGYSLATWGSPIRAFVVAADQFLAKLDASGSLLWNTFLGGTGNDYNNGLAVDGSGNCLCRRRQPGDLGLPGQSHGRLSRRLPGLDDRQGQQQRRPAMEHLSRRYEP